MKNIGKFSLALVALLIALTQKTIADEVLDWNAILRRSVAATPAAAGAPGFRLAAIVQASVYDAVNGIDQRFAPIHVTSQAPAGASRRAAVVQAAYTSQLALFPAQSAALDQDLATSLAVIAADVTETSEAIASGRAWGEQVANAILTWRSTDGFDPSPSTYTGSLIPGKWRPTPPANANGLVPSLAHTLPWVIPSPSSFRPPGPPDLTSAKYTADFIEEKAVGDTNSTVRTADQTQAARFWAGTALTFWNRAAANAAVQRHTTLSENARLFALLNVAMADGAISCWDAKYHYELWRPITAIRLASTDGNPDTEEQADWTPLIVTPPYPEYSSGHASVSGAGQAVLTSYFGNDLPVEGWSEAFGEATVRSWPNFSAAADEANLARIWAGIHWRTAVVDARAAGNAIGAYVMANAAQKIADEVLDWNAILRRTLVATPSAGGSPGFRLAAIVQASVFDALNGIDGGFTPIHVSGLAPAGASRRAAVVQAAYTSLLALFPAQSDALAQDLTNSLARIAADAPAESSESIASGRAWGEQVANEILAWRSTDGFDPSPSTYTGSLEPGKWRPTPPANANGFVPSLAHTLPWVIPSPSSFRPPGPPDLTSAQYTADFNEEKAIGETNSTFRSPDQTLAARFWAGTALTFWNRAGANAAVQQHRTLSENARLFALLNVAMADGAISCWDAKYYFEYWRPITAIRLASTDDNPNTAEQADWTPLIVTPPYPEYSSGHATVSGAGQAVLTAYFGNNLPVEGWSEAFGESTVRSWPNFSAAVDEANLARIWAGIHWRTAVVDGRAAGNAVGAYVMSNAAQERQKDVILQHTDGSVAFWTMNGTTIVDGIVPYTVPAGWQIVGAGDFNHDDQSDVVLQHTDGSVAFWLMQGTTITEGIVLFAVPEGWRIVATGDFNNDSQVDLVLQNVNGLIAFWFMDGTSVIGTQLSYQASAGWRVAGTGRFDHDAATDLVLQHTDGSVAFWLLDGTTLLNGVLGEQIPNAWQIVATGNFNSDNDTDIVLQHTDGSVAFWLMDGTTIAEGVAPYSVPAGWQIVGPR